MKVFIPFAGVLLVAGGLAFGQVSTNSFFNWETPPVHPVALSPDGAQLVVCNLPDNRIEIFSVTNGLPVPRGNVSVGLDPCSVRFRSADEVWVANFISDSVSVVSLSAMRVVATLSVSNEPSDIVFAGTPQRAFVSCAQPGLVQVFNAATRSPTATLTIDGNRPKAMAVSPDGNQVYVAIFESGNASTIIGAGVNLGLPPPTPVDFPDSPSHGLNPPPNRGTNFVPAINPAIPSTNLPPRVGLIVKKNSSGRWMDDNEGDWTDYISGSNSIFSGRPLGWDLPDHDLAVIDANNLAVSYANGLMNICMDVAVNPASGKITVIGTDALNQIRFEPVLNGIFVRAEMASVDPGNFTNQVTDLNPHLNYSSSLVSPGERNKSLGDPRGIAWNSNGTRGYVTGMGSDNLAIVNPAGQRVGTNTIPLGKGPTGLALDEPRHRLYVLNRFSATLSVVDTTTESVVQTVPLFDPTPTVIRLGRPHLYDTHKSSGLGQASCGSCHVDGRFDRLAWDLGDPTGVMKNLTNANFGRFPPPATNHFHPMKGPTTTQTLQDIIGHEPFHWRGDRFGLEEFSGTFTNLQGAPATLTTNEMQQFEDFLATVRFAPNPYRTLSNTLATSIPLPGQKALGHGTLPSGAQLPNGNAVNGQTRFRLQGTTGCIHCHTLPAGLGTDLRWTGFQWISTIAGPSGERHAAYAAIERSSLLPFKIQSLRNLYDKLGMDFLNTSNRSGFGFFHDGSVDTLVRFVQDGFDLRTDQETADMVAFLLSFTGSDLLPGSSTDPDRAPGLPSRDTHAAVGRQITVNSSATVPLIDSLIAIATPATSRVDVVVKGFKDGLARGWFFNRTNGLFQSDRLAETLTPAVLRTLASVGSELTYTAVPRESGRRIGIDRDEDGYYDRDELDFGSDPANPLSLATNRPPILASLTNRVVFAGQTISFTAPATDPDLPVQELTFRLGGSPPAGATINPTNGLFTWTPNATQAPSTNTITIVVTDNGSPNKSDAKDFAFTVLELRVNPPALGTNGVSLSWTAVAGLNFRLQYKTNLEDVGWIDLTGDIMATNGIVTVADPAIYPQRFYRLMLLP
jgi:YVTN family beta-propeller protein